MHSTEGTFFDSNANLLRNYKYLALQTLKSGVQSCSHKSNTMVRIEEERTSSCASDHAPDTDDGLSNGTA
jgi:hypothetical protein